MTNGEMQKNTAIRRVKYLTLMQIGDELRVLKTGNRKKLVASVGLRLLAVALVTAALFVLFMLLNSTFQLTASRDMLVTILFITQVVSVISCLSGMMLVLFASKENTMLLAFPCNYTEIFISKIVVFALEEFKKSCYFLLPLLIGFGLNAGVGVEYWLQLPVFWITLCLLPVFIGATLTIPVLYIKRFLQTHVWIYAILLIALIVAGFIGIYSVLSQVPVPIRLVAIYGKFVEAVKAAFVAINQFAIFYNFIGDALFGQMVWLYLPVMLLILAAFATLCFFVAMPFYFKAASSTAENSSQKKHYHNRLKHGNLFFTFFGKELRIMLRSFQSVTSLITVVFIFPVITYVFNFILSAINTSTIGDYMTIAFNVMITLSLLGSHNANTAASLSSEGNEFAVLKTAPSDTSVICWTKIAVTGLVNLLSLVVTAIMLLITTRLPLIDIIFTMFTILLISVGQIAWSFEFDLRNPKITDYATKGDGVVDNVNIAKAIGVSFVVATLAGLVGLLCLFDQYVFGWVRLLGFALIFLLARLYLLNSNIKVYFNDIQG